MDNKEQIILSYTTCANLFNQKMMCMIIEHNVSRHRKMSYLIYILVIINSMITMFIGFKPLYFIISCIISILIISIIYWLLNRRDVNFIAGMHPALIGTLESTFKQKYASLFESDEEFNKFYKTELLPLFMEISLFD